MYAAIHGDTSLIRRLVQSGTDPNAASRAYLTEGFDGWTAMMWGAYKCNPDVVRELLNLGSDVDRTDASGKTALHVALMVDCNVVADILLSSGANPNAAMWTGDTPLHFAVRAKNYAAVRKLVAAGAKVDVVGAYDLTPLRIAETNGTTDEVVQFLRLHTK